MQRMTCPEAGRLRGRESSKETSAVIQMEMGISNEALQNASNIKYNSLHVQVGR